MDLRSLRAAGFIASFVHLLIIALVAGMGAHLRSPLFAAVLTATWLLLFVAVYGAIRRNYT